MSSHRNNYPNSGIPVPNTPHEDDIADSEFFQSEQKSVEKEIPSLVDIIAVLELQRDAETDWRKKASLSAKIISMRMDTY